MNARTQRLAAVAFRSLTEGNEIAYSKPSFPGFYDDVTLDGVYDLNKMVQAILDADEVWPASTAR